MPSTAKSKTIGKAGKTIKTKVERDVFGTSVLLKTRLTIESNLTNENPEDGSDDSGPHSSFLFVLITTSVLMMALWLTLILVYVHRKCCRPIHQMREQQATGTVTCDTRETEF
jgi:hypothetical protein